MHAVRAEPVVDDVVAALESATVSTERRLLLGPVSLTLRVGEHWAVLGPNGAGKSTLLSLLAAERHPTTGQVVIFDKRIGHTDMRLLRGKIGFVGQGLADRLPLAASARDIVLTGRDGILAPHWARFDDDDRARADVLLVRLGCAHLIGGQSLLQCSQGERQRVLLARSLFGNHRLLLLDEAAVGLDLPGREALISALDALASSPDAPVTVQVVHTLEELPASTSHALLLREGRVVAFGQVDGVLTDRQLSACYGIDVHVETAAGRYHARAASSF